MDVRAYRPADEEAVVALWEACGLVVPWNDPHRDITRKQAVQPELFQVAEDKGRVVGAAMAGYDGHRGWVYYVAVDPTRRRHGLGRRLMAAAEAALLDLGCPKVNVQVRAGNEAVVGFYEALGYQVEERVSLGKRLIVDGPAEE